MIRPKRPNTDEKISMTRILTNLANSQPRVRLPVPACDQNLQARVRSICQSCTATVDAHTNTANQVTHAAEQTTPEDCVAGVVVATAVQRIPGDVVDL